MNLRMRLHSPLLTGGTAVVNQTARDISIRADLPAARAPAQGAGSPLSPATDRSAAPQIDAILKLELDGSAMDLEPLG